MLFLIPKNVKIVELEICSFIQFPEYKYILDDYNKNYKRVKRPHKLNN